MITSGEPWPDARSCASLTYAHRSVRTRRMWIRDQNGERTGQRAGEVVPRYTELCAEVDGPAGDVLHQSYPSNGSDSICIQRTHIREVFGHGDLQRLQLARRSNTGQEQELRRAHRSRT